jgi:peptide-methionine (S)-S-oxide reductase
MISRTRKMFALALAAGAAAATVVFSGGLAARETVVSLPDPRTDQAAPGPAHEQSAVFAGGCFWGVQAVFSHLQGVREARSGYAGGHSANPTYEQVSTGTTGHAESVSVRYDPNQISYGQLLKVFLSVAHDPTQLNRQGPDVGTQYRSIIFYANDEQRIVAAAYLEQLRAAGVFARPIVTEVMPLQRFYMAEAYHQDYLAQHPTNAYIVYNDLPKLDHLKATFPALYRP